MTATGYDPFSPGPFAAELRSVELRDTARQRLFPVDVWSPQGAAGTPLVVYSHHSGGNRRVATFLCRHLASRGYEVAAMDHSEVVARDQLPGERAKRIEAIIGGRVPDVRFLVDQLGQNEVALVGHSFGGWTVLATPEVDDRVVSVVAMGPGGSDKPRPGILPVKLTFRWRRAVPVMYLAAENDVPIPLADVYELFDRTPEPKCMFILRRSDHQHFLDDVEEAHEAVRRAEFPPEAAWIPETMAPIDLLTGGEQAHDFVRGLTLAHLDATVRGLEPAREFLDQRAIAELAGRGVDAMPPSPSASASR